MRSSTAPDLSALQQLQRCVVAGTASGSGAAADNVAGSPEALVDTLLSRGVEVRALLRY